MERSASGRPRFTLHQQPIPRSKGSDICADNPEFSSDVCGERKAITDDHVCY
jgi:hypothetical protein